MATGPAVPPAPRGRRGTGRCRSGIFGVTVPPSSPACPPRCHRVRQAPRPPPAPFAQPALSPTPRPPAHPLRCHCSRGVRARGRTCHPTSYPGTGSCQGEGHPSVAPGVLGRGNQHNPDPGDVQGLPWGLCPEPAPAWGPPEPHACPSPLCGTSAGPKPFLLLLLLLGMAIVRVLPQCRSALVQPLATVAGVPQAPSASASPSAPQPPPLCQPLAGTKPSSCEAAAPTHDQHGNIPPSLPLSHPRSPLPATAKPPALSLPAGVGKAPARLCPPDTWHRSASGGLGPQHSDGPHFMAPITPTRGCGGSEEEQEYSPVGTIPAGTHCLPGTGDHPAPCPPSSTRDWAPRRGVVALSPVPLPQGPTAPASPCAAASPPATYVPAGSWRRRGSSGSLLTAQAAEGAQTPCRGLGRVPRSLGTRDTQAGSSPSQPGGTRT